MAMLAMLGIAGAVPTATSLTPSNSVIDSGQYVTYTVSVSSANVPFTANLVLVSNTIPISINGVSAVPGSVVNTIVSSTNGIVTFNSLLITTTSSTGGTATFNVIATDSTPTTFNSVSNTITVDPALSVSISPTSATYDAGQTITLTATPSGGTGSYSYQWYNDTSGSGVAISGKTSATFTETAGATAQTVKYYVIVTDTATTPDTATSTTGSYTVDPALSVSISPTSATYDAGQTITLTATPSGGTGSYSYQWYNDTSGSGVAISGKTSATFTETAGATAQTVKYYVIVTDTATTPDTATSTTGSYTVDPAPSITLTATPSNSIPYGKSFTVNAVISGGTGHFAVYWFLNSNSITPTVISANTETSNTMQLPAAGNYAYTVEANDIGTSSVDVLTPATNTVVVSSNSTLTASEAGNPGTSYFEQPVSITFTGTSTINNQSAWSLYVNGVLFGKTASKITWSESMKNPGTYAFTFNNPGNSNYTSNTLTATLNIVYPPSGVTGPATTVTTTIPTTTVTTTIPPTPIVGSSGTVNKTISSSTPVTLNFSNELAIFSISTTSSTSAPISTFVANATKIAPPAPSNFTLINALNISIKTNVNVTTNVTIAYPCSDSASSIEPFIYKNGTWSAITPFFVNPSTCTVSFAVPSDPLVGIFAKTVPVTTTVPTTTVAPATTIPTTVPVTPVTSHYTSLEIAIVVIVIIIIIMVIAYYYAAKGKHRHR
ncbi:MAG: hypothetical protein M1360_01435 [Candidatus Marsarchaeota archaeon]|nr:hypothetical protein [Candidatus Marsarchaeota archaeon]MCL5418584.1 hypothetical protein [Candidatus Marsarchaeota archaeon]